MPSCKTFCSVFVISAANLIEFVCSVRCYGFIVKRIHPWQEIFMKGKMNILVREILLAGLTFYAGSHGIFAQSGSKAPLPTSIPDLKSVEQDDRILKAAPSVDVQADGTAVISFETMVATPPARLYAGLRNPDMSLDTPYFRIAEQEAAQEPSTRHRIRFNLQQLETPEQRAAGAPHDDDITYRLEIFDPRIAGAKYFQSRFHYFAEGGRYERRTGILFGPFVDQVTANSALIFWTTDRPSRGVVELLPAKAGGHSKSFLDEPAPQTDHKIKITGLSLGQVSKYRVLVFDAASEKPVAASTAYSFHAAPTKTQKFEFAFLSDGRPPLGGGFLNFNGVNAEVTQRLLIDGYRRGAELILFGGDLIAGYTSIVENFDLMLDTWKTVSEPVGHVIPIYEGFGNHESLHNFYVDADGNRYHTDKNDEVSSESEFARHFANPEDSFPAPEVLNGVTGPSYKGTVYSFDYGNSHFVMLNMDYWYTGGGPSGDPALAWKLLGGNRNGYLMENQLKWLAQDLAAAQKRGVQHIFVCGHDMAFPTGGHAGDAMWWNGLNDATIPVGDVMAMRDRFMKLANDYHVTALFFGHEHNYSRTIIDHSVDKVMRHPVTQIVSGGAGAPFYPRDTQVPWSSAVQKYSMTNHYVLVTVDGAKVSLEAIDIDGNLIDHTVLP